MKSTLSDGRPAIMVSASCLPFMLPGIRLKTSRTDYRPMEQVYLYRYDNKQWVRASGLLPARG